MKKLFLILVSIVMLMGCSLFNTTTMNYKTIETSSSSRSVRAISEDAVDLSKVYFRSSDISFYSFEGIEDIYEGILETCAPIDLGNLEESVLFEPGEVILSEVADDIVLETKLYNFIKIDAGDGTFTFQDLDGNLITEVKNINTGNLFSCRSIVLIDNELLTEPVFLPSFIFENYFVNGTSDLSELSIIDDNKELIEAIIKNSGFEQLNLVDNGGNSYDYSLLLMPFTPIDLSSHTSISGMNFIFSWDMIGSLNYNETDGYYMESRVDGCCFDFDMEISVIE